MTGPVTVAPGLHTPSAHSENAPPIHSDGDSSMAEIRVEPRRRSLAWLWILLSLLIIGGLVYYLLYYHHG